MGVAESESIGGAQDRAHIPGGADVIQQHGRVSGFLNIIDVWIVAGKFFAGCQAGLSQAMRAARARFLFVRDRVSQSTTVADANFK